MEQRFKVYAGVITSAGARRHWLKGELRHGVRFRGNQMRDFGRARDMKTGDFVLQHPICVGDAFVLAQVFEPRLDEKCLDKATFLGGILEYCPPVGPVAPALTCQFVHAGEKSVSVSWGNLVFDGHQHRSAVVLDFACRDRWWFTLATS